MKKLLLITSFLASQLFAIQCTEQQYSPYFTDKQENRYMFSYSTVDGEENVIDKESISYNQNNQIAKSLTIHQDLVDSINGYAMILREFDLKNNEVRVISGTLYDCKGSIIKNFTRTGWEPIRPSSGNENNINDLKKYLKIK